MVPKVNVEVETKIDRIATSTNGIPLVRDITFFELIVFPLPLSSQIKALIYVFA